MVGVAALAVVIVIVGVLVVTRNGDDSASPKAGSGFVEPTNSPTPSPSPLAAKAPACPDEVARSFAPDEHHRHRRGPTASP